MAVLGRYDVPAPDRDPKLDLHGNSLARYPLAANQFCNDLTFDGAGNLYATDSFSGAIVELAAGDDKLETFVRDPRFAAVAQGAFGLDGIAYDGAGSLYVGTFDAGGLYRVALATGEIAIATSQPLAAPDGLRALDAHTLLVIEGGAGKLTKLAVSGDTATATALASDLDEPTGVVVTRGSAWVSEGQLGRLFASPPQAPNLPFAVRRVQL